MNYNRTIIITLLALLSLCSVLARADDIPVSYKKTTYPALNDAVQKRGLFDDSIQLDTERLKAGSKVTLSKNYPVVPYDPNHPNVKKQSSFNIKANAKTLAGRFARGLNGVALGYAAVEILGEGVDWVLDPENNTIRYTTDEYDSAIGSCRSNNGEYGNIAQIASKVCQSMNQSLTKYTRKSDTHLNGKYRPTFDVRCNPGSANVVCGYPKPQEQTLSLDTIANHVINNETVNNTTNNTTNITNHYHEAVNDTLVEQINKGEHDTEISTAVRNVSQPDDSTNDKTDNKEQPQEQPSDETKPQDETKFPEFCDWAGVVCDFIDWVKQEPPEPPPPEQVPKANLSDLGLDENELFKQRVQFDGQCPKHELKFAINGKQIIEPIPTHHFCNLLEQIAPWLLAFSYLSAGFFVIRNL